MQISIVQVYLDFTDAFFSRGLSFETTEELVNALNNVTHVTDVCINHQCWLEVSLSEYDEGIIAKVRADASAILHSFGLA